MPLSYKTRGMSKPNGKARVYFCCHPDDFDLYFDAISDEILAIQNCAVWYDRTDSPLDADFLLELSEMQLFVIPVTSKLLTTPNRTMDEVFPFAVEKHIPVLPLMQEQKLEDLFNRRFGDLQFLDKNINDATAIRYEEKLTKFLNSVLVGDDLADKVRAAFDAYIFLSYRKKDRKYAQELMRLIHKNDFCRDIAIWYDEFLVPGENFNDAIADALTKCDLFTLAVTPNLINETNYVMTTEYPAAREAGKPILPAEVVTTDHTQMREKYDGIPDCVDARDSRGLSSALLSSLKKTAVTENDSDPRHNFFIGLAYLSGIDVEVDYDRALTLITGSAEAGLPEAVQKLTDMYRTGMGVSRDLAEAIRWQQRLTQLLRAVYEESRTAENYYELFLACNTLSGYLYEQRRLTEAFDTCRQMTALCGEWLEELPAARRDLSVSYTQLGLICQEQGNLTDAGKYFRESLTLDQGLAKGTDSEQALLDLSVSYGNLGLFCKAQDRLAEARDYYRKGLDVIEKMAAEREMSSDPRYLLSAWYDNIGTICRQQGCLAEAEDYCRKSLSLDEALAVETDTAHAKSNLWMCCNHLGMIRADFGDLTGAETFLRRALDISEALVEETGTVGDRLGLSDNYFRLSDILLSQGRLNEALDYCRKNLTLCEELAEETQTIQSRRNLATCLALSGNLCYHQGDLRETAAYYEKNLTLAKELAEETNMPQDRRSLAQSYDTLRILAEVEQKLSQAEQYCRDKLSIIDALAKETDLTEDHLSSIETKMQLGEICRLQDRMPDALACYREAGEDLKSVRRLIADRKIDSADILRKEAALLGKFGVFRYLQEDLTTAESYYQEWRSAAEALAERTGTIQERRSLSDCYYYLGALRAQQTRYDLAEAHFLDAVAIREELAEETGAVPERFNVATGYLSLGDLAEVTGDEKKKKEMLGRAYDILTQLYETAPNETIAGYLSMLEARL